MKDALAIHRMLLERETLHEIVRLPRAIANADELPEVLGLPAERCLATRVYVVQPVLRPGAPRGARLLAAMINRAGDGPTPEAVRSELGARSARPAPADLINKVTDYAADLVAPLLLPESMPLLVDESVIDKLGVDDVVYTATGEPGIALGIRALDLFAISGAKPVGLQVVQVEPPGEPPVVPPPIDRAHRSRVARSHRS